VQPEMKSNAQSGAHFQLVVFDGPLEVDWNARQSARDLAHPSPACRSGNHGRTAAELN
jgi:hypothetical protein